MKPDDHILNLLNEYKHDALVGKDGPPYFVAKENVLGQLVIAIAEYLLTHKCKCNR